MKYWLAFSILIICAILFLLNKWINNYINPNTYPNNIWYRNNLIRNYKYLVLGNGIVRDSFPVDWRKGEGFNLALRNQSLKRDFEVLKQNFSILKESGYAVFVLTEDSLYRTNDVSDKRPYIYTLYSYTLSLNHAIQSYKKLCKYFPILMFRPVDVYYWFLHIRGKNEQTYFDMKRLLAHREYKDVNLDEFMNLVLEIKTFCESRGINVIFPILNFKDFGDICSNEALNQIVSVCNTLNVKSYLIDVDLRSSYNIQDLVVELQ